ncbi:MAG TPA: VWA domain-containing protein [Acidobacteriota bacterium]|nr:VWA domain-containing protein [Acidobacteriota bacterium]
MRNSTKAEILLTAILVLSAFAVFMRAQESPTYKVDVSVVNVLATVRDHDGRIVNGLSKDDFILEEDGKLQEIRYFSRQTDMPLTMGLLIDTSLSQKNLIEDERSASYRFLDQVLRPDRDQAFVIKFDFEAELLQDLTNSREFLQKALNDLRVPEERRRAAMNPEVSVWPADSLAQSWPGGVQLPGGQRRPGGGGRRDGRYPGEQRRSTGGGTVLYDSVFLASDEILKRQEGRKAIILISDGVDHGSKVSEKEATDAAHHADALIYCIRYYDSAAYSGFNRGGAGRDEGSQGAKTLKMLSQETGGRMFEVSKKLSLKEIYDRIQEELRNQYNIGYIPSDPTGAGFRHIKLRTKDGKYEVVARSGYYPRS